MNDKVYVLSVEHLVLQNGDLVDASFSYNMALGPKDESEALEYFRKTRFSDSTNIYGVTNRSKVIAVYKEIGRYE